MKRHILLYRRAMVEACGRGATLRIQALQVLGAALEGVVLVLLFPLLQVLAGAEAATLPWIGVDVHAGAAITALAFAVVLRAGTLWLTAILSTSLRIRTTDMLRLRALGSVLEAEWGFLARQRRSDVVQATTTEIERVESAVLLLLLLGVNLFTVLATAAVGIVVSPLVGGIAVLLLVPLILVGHRSLRRSVSLGAEGVRRNAVFGATVTDSLASLRLVRAHDAGPAWMHLLADAAAAGRRVERRFIESTAGLQAVLGVAAVAVALAMVLLGRALGLGVAELVTLAVVITRTLALARATLQTAQAFAHQAPAIDSVQRITAAAQAHTEQRASDGTAGWATPPQLLLRAVTVGYGDEPALRNLSVELPAGAFTAVTGPSGAGKSTLLDVLLGLLPPQAGEVLADGRPITDVTAWRSVVGYVPQQTVLVPGTVRQNLVWCAGRPVTDDDVWAALETACAADVVRRLPLGLDTVLQDAVQLSGGEQQRLCIARALVRAPRLLVLDEATSGLDRDTEIRLLEHLRELDATVVMATHRPAVVEAADQVVELGAVAWSGQASGGDLSGTRDL